MRKERGRKLARERKPEERKKRALFSVPVYFT